MEPNNSKRETQENEKIIPSNDEEHLKIVDNLKEIVNLSVYKLEEKISKEIKE